MRKIVSFVLCIVIMIMITSCFPYQGGTAGFKEPQTVVVHYYGEKTKTYTSASGEKTIATNFIAPSGQVIKGLFDESGVQYAGYDCIIDLKSNPQLPSDLYAEYENVDISFLDENPMIIFDEEPVKISFFSSYSHRVYFEQSNPDEQKLIAACKCNPYADLTITVTFYGKGFGASHSNEFYSMITMGEDTIGSFTTENFASKTEYAKYTYTCTVKAKQLTNANFEFHARQSAQYGYEDYTIKNVRIDMAFTFDN